MALLLQQASRSLLSGVLPAASCGLTGALQRGYATSDKFTVEVCGSGRLLLQWGSGITAAAAARSRQRSVGGCDETDATCLGLHHVPPPTHPP
jgi:hypothetical protein